MWKLQIHTKLIQTYCMICEKKNMSWTNLVQFNGYVVVDQISLKSTCASLEALGVDERGWGERRDGAFDALPLRLQVLLFLPAHPTHLGQVGVHASYLLRSLWQQPRAALLVKVARLGALRLAPARISVLAETIWLLVSRLKYRSISTHSKISYENIQRKSEFDIFCKIF